MLWNRSLQRGVRGGKVLAACIAASCLSTAAHAEVISGSMTGVGLNDFNFNAGVFGDGINSVEFIAQFASWSQAQMTGSMWFYGSEFNYDDGSLAKSEVAFVPGVLDISQITDASVYTYTVDATATHVAVTGGASIFGSEQGLVLLRNLATGHYGAVRLDGMTVAGGGFVFDAESIDVTWWFQTDGTGDFSSVPTPASAALFACTGLLGARGRRR